MFRHQVAAHRNTQLDGWRAFAVAGVMWHHWAPVAWKRPFPFEIGLFFFLKLTGFLITRILLRERAAGESGGFPWRLRAFGYFQGRRMGRILLPCYVAMVFAILVGAPDIRSHAAAYFCHVSNFHMAFLPNWPSGTAPFWTLAIQMQFYFVWPLVVFFVPRRALGWVFGICVLVAPLSRSVIQHQFPEVQHTGAITTSAFDYFGVGALLALAFERGMKAGNSRISLAAWLAFTGYLTIYACNLADRPVGWFGYLQQTLLALAIAGLISSTQAGLTGIVGKALDHPAVQHIGRLSYGLYLFHALVPLLLGHVVPFLWSPFFSGPWLAARLVVFALVSWGAAWLCWRWLEGPDRLRLPRLAAGWKR